VLPVLFPGTAFEVPTYFVLLMLSALGAIICGIYKAKAYGLKSYRAVDIGFIGFVGGLVGGRLAHVLIEAPGYYWESPIRVFYFWQGGFVLYGGLIGGSLSGVLAIKLLKEPVIQWLDALAVAVLVGVAIGRMGCLAGGCCYGLPTDSFIGMTFNHPLAAAPLHQSVYPTQLMEAAFCGLVALILWFAFRKPPKWGGSAFAIAAISYAVFRFLIEFIRGDAERGVYASGMITTSQIISIIVVIAAFIFIGWTRSSKRGGEHCHEQSH
jgi:phosphatidylglycerol:prolipoprotein diacylglycerol transferase